MNLTTVHALLATARLDTDAGLSAREELIAEGGVVEQLLDILCADEPGVEAIESRRKWRVRWWTTKPKTGPFLSTADDDLETVLAHRDSIMRKYNSVTAEIVRTTTTVVRVIEVAGVSTEVKLGE